jgi:hypothetical protein
VSPAHPAHHYETFWPLHKIAVVAEHFEYATEIRGLLSQSFSLPSAGRANRLAGRTNLYRNFCVKLPLSRNAQDKLKGI